MTQGDPFAGLFWLELREPRCTPERKGPFKADRMASTLREFFDARPSAFITVVTVSHDGPDFQDGPECLQMIDGRSMERARRHMRSSIAAFVARAVASPSQPERAER